MKLAMILFSFAVLAGFAGCSSDSSGDGGVTGLEFGEACTENGNCVSNVCAVFEDGSRLCSNICGSDQACPEGSSGQKCNGKGYCVP